MRRVASSAAGCSLAPARPAAARGEKEARRVREIFGLYQTHRSLVEVVAQLGGKRRTNKSWKSKRGMSMGRPFTQATVRNLLSNAIYAGKVAHKGTIYPGEHAPIVEASLWEEFNAEIGTRPTRSILKRFERF